MAYSYKIVYDEPYEFNGGLHQMDPTYPVPVPSDHSDYGRTLQDVTGMTDAEAASIITSAKWTQVREYRAAELKASDWVSGEDVPQSIKDAWFPYRQALRDITNAASPDDVVWPEKPEA